MHFQKFRHRLHRNLRRLVIGEVKLTCADAAEGDRSNLLLCTALQNIPVAVLQITPQRLRQPPAHDRAHGMDHVLCRQIVSLRQNSLPGY